MVALELKPSVLNPRQSWAVLCQVTHRAYLLADGYTAGRLESAYLACHSGRHGRVAPLEHVPALWERHARVCGIEPIATLPGLPIGRAVAALTSGRPWEPTLSAFTTCPHEQVVSEPTRYSPRGARARVHPLGPAARRAGPSHAPASALDSGARGQRCGPGQPHRPRASWALPASRRQMAMRSRAAAAALDPVTQLRQQRVYVTPRNHERRDVTIDPRTVAALRAWRKAQMAERLEGGAAYQGAEDLVFTWEDGRPVPLDFVTKAFGALTAGLDMPRLKLHEARHMHATMLLRDGCRCTSSPSGSGTRTRR